MVKCSFILFIPFPPNATNNHISVTHPVGNRASQTILTRLIESDCRTVGLAVECVDLLLQIFTSFSHCHYQTDIRNKSSFQFSSHDTVHHHNCVQLTENINFYFTNVSVCYKLQSTKANFHALHQRREKTLLRIR